LEDFELHFRRQQESGKVPPDSEIEQKLKELEHK